MDNLIYTVPVFSEVQLIIGPNLVPVDTISRITEAIHQWMHSNDQMYIWS